MLNSHATTIAPKPTSAPIARLNAPADSGMTSAMAANAVSACWERIDRQVSDSRNVSGTHSENSRNIAAKM